MVVLLRERFKTDDEQAEIMMARQNYIVDWIRTRNELNFTK